MEHHARGSQASGPALHTESGVRNLEREISNLVGKAVKEILLSAGTDAPVTTVAIDEAKVEAYLGPAKYRYGEAETEDQVGVVTGWPGPRWAANC